MKTQLLEKIPPEPSADTPNVISVVFKLSNGERIERRFLHTDALTVRVRNIRSTAIRIELILLFVIIQTVGYIELSLLPSIDAR